MVAAQLAVDDPAIERLDAASPKLIETILCAARGFHGSDTVAPEGMLDWCFGVDYRAAGETIVLGEPLGAGREQPAERLAHFTQICYGMFTCASREQRISEHSQYQHNAQGA